MRRIGCGPRCRRQRQSPKAAREPHIDAMRTVGYPAGCATMTLYTDHRSWMTLTRASLDGALPQIAIQVLPNFGCKHLKHPEHPLAAYCCLECLESIGYVADWDLRSDNMVTHILIYST